MKRLLKTKIKTAVFLLLANILICILSLLLEFKTSLWVFIMANSYCIGMISGLFPFAGFFTVVASSFTVLILALILTLMGGGYTISFSIIFVLIILPSLFFSYTIGLALRAFLQSRVLEREGDSNGLNSTS